MRDTENRDINVKLTFTAGELHKLHRYCDENAYDLNKWISKTIREKLSENECKVKKPLLVEGS